VIRPDSPYSEMVACTLPCVLLVALLSCSGGVPAGQAPTPAASAPASAAPAASAQSATTGAAADPTPSIDTAGWAAPGIEVPQQIEDPAQRKYLGTCLAFTKAMKEIAMDKGPSRVAAIERVSEQLKKSASGTNVEDIRWCEAHLLDGVRRYLNRVKMSPTGSTLPAPPPPLGKTAPPSSGPLKIGQTVEIELSLVTGDYEDLACTMPGAIAGRYCAFTAEDKPNPKVKQGGARKDANLLQPIMATIDGANVIALAAGLWVQPELAAKLDKENWDRPSPRFKAKCKLAVEEHARAMYRWRAGEGWHNDDLFCGAVSDCQLVK